MNLPDSWTELTQEELRVVYILKASVPPEDLPTRVFLYFAGCRVVRPVDDGFLCSFTVDDSRRVSCVVKPSELAELLGPLGFLSSPGKDTVRLDVMRGRSAVDPGLHGVSFSDYITIENCYQGFLATRSEKALASMARKLYPGLQAEALSMDEQLNVLSWVVQIKSLLSESFPNFFRPVRDESGQASEMSQLEVMNNEIRILTGGDVTKERDILAIDCWRALTELDFKAKEAAEMNERLKKK